MARIIIEVSDGYFAERSNFENIEAQAKNKDADAMTMFLDLVVFKGMARLVEEKKITQFTINRSCLPKEDDLKVFNRVMRGIGALICADRYKEAKPKSDE